MTKIKNPNEHGPASEGVLIDFEKSIGTKLPEEYRKFLIKTNGGDPSPNCFMVNDGEEEWESDFFLYGLQGDAYHLYSLPTNYKEYIGRIPTDLVPKHRGQVYFWPLVANRSHK